MSIKPCYPDQNNWSGSDFYSPHRYLHRLVLHADRKKDEIAQLDTQKMSEKTKVLLYCIINYYHLEKLFELSDLSDLKNCKPLSEPLILGSHGMKEESIYYKMNVVF